MIGEKLTDYRERRDAFLRAEGVYLSEAWTSFQERLPPEERATFEGRAPTILDVVKTVSDISATWELKRKQGKYGMAKQYFHNFSSGVGAHATMLEVLPAGNEYVSLFTGVLKSVIKASSNHEKIALGLGKSLSEITNVVGDCARFAHLYSTEDVQMLIANLYAHIFLFLKDSMSWYLDKHRKRILHSFREDFYDNFEDQVSNIKKIASQVKHRADVGMSAEQRVTRLAIERTHAAVEDLRLHTSGSARETAELLEAVKKMEQRAIAEDQRKDEMMQQTPAKLQAIAAYIATHMFELLETHASGWLESRKDCPARDRIEEVRIHNSPLQNLLESTPTELANRETYLMASRGVESYFDRDQIRLSFESSATVTVTSDVVQRLREFITGSEERILAIAGPKSLDHQGNSTTTKVAENFVNHTTEIGLPVVSWFCQLPSDHVGLDNMTREWSAFVSLVYALIRQLIELLPLKPRAPISVNLDNLETLDDTTASIDAAIVLLRDLLAQMDSTLFIVVDGLEWLEDTTTAQHLRNFVRALVEASTNTHQVPGQSHPLVRILLTTTGRSRTLLGVLGPRAYLLADGGGRSSKGARGHRIVW